MNHCLLKMKEASEDLTQAKFDAFMAFMERKPNATAKQIEQFSNSLDSGNENNQEMSRNHLNLRQ